MNNMARKKQADEFLYKFGLLDKLKEYGEPHIIGSYCMDTMAWNDLDIFISNEAMSLERLYKLSDYILGIFKPFWYEAKQVTDENETPVWFHGFETTITGELWNFDLWFRGKGDISEAKRLIADINEKTNEDPALKESIISIKKALIDMGQYNYEPYTSMDVYNAVLEHGVKTIGEFLSQCSK